MAPALWHIPVDVRDRNAAQIAVMTAPSAPEPSLGLRVTATAVAVVALFVLADLVLRGLPLAPRYTLLASLPMAPIGAMHALALLVSLWWPRPPHRVERVVTAIVLFGGMLVVAGGIDAAFAQVRFFLAEARAFDSYRLGAGVATALEGALAVIVIWSRRAPVHKRPMGAIRIRRYDEY